MGRSGPGFCSIWEAADIAAFGDMGVMDGRPTGIGAHFAVILDIAWAKAYPAGQTLVGQRPSPTITLDADAAATG
jgi:hypothetical protein